MMRLHFGRLISTRDGRPFGLLAVLVLAAFSLTSPAHAQTTDRPELRRAIAAYDSGDLQRALELLNLAPEGLPPRDRAIRSLYHGLIQFALGNVDRARQSFQVAIAHDPALRLDPAVHAPSRLRAFEEARLAVVSESREAARVAQAGGNAAEARRHWEYLLVLAPGDSEASEALERLRSAPPERVATRPAPARGQPLGVPATEAPRGRVLGEEMGGNPPPLEATGVTPEESSGFVPPYNPQQAALLGVVPGLGHFYTDRPGRALLVLGGAGAALAVGLFKENVSVRCLTVPVDGECPPELILSRDVERPYLGPAVAVAAVITLVGALDAYHGAREANLRALTRSSSAASPRGNGLTLAAPAVVPGGDRLNVELLRARF